MRDSGGIPGRKVPNIRDVTLDQAAESVRDRIASNGRNRCVVLIDGDGFIRVRSAYLPFRRSMRPEWIVGTMNYNTPLAAIRNSLGRRIQEMSS